MNLLKEMYAIRIFRRCYNKNAIKVPYNDFQGIKVDLRSDTLTCPGPAMKAAMVNAALGDDVYGEDPTVKEFERRAAKLTGKENALFVPTGTMGNLISVLIHCDKRGSEVLLGDKSHLFLYEQGGISQFGGVHTHIVSNLPDGTMDIEEIKSRIRYYDDHCPTTNLICIENTHNYSGGKVLPLQWIQQIGQVAKSHNISLHVDGARIMNAAVASKTDVAEILASCDSTQFCLSKGLGTPIGSVMVGSDSFIARSRRIRKALGGGMRQVGVLAAAGLYALDNMIERLSEDHENARLIALSINDAKSKNVNTVPENVETNIALVEVNPKVITPEDFCERLLMITEDEEKVLGEKIIVRMMPWSDNSVRFVTHFNVTPSMVEAVCAKLKYVISEIENQI